MRKEDINRIFEGATDEQVKALLDINSADITKALGKQKSDGEKLQADLDAANAALADAKSTIANLEAAKGDTDKLQKELDEYEKNVLYPLSTERIEIDLDDGVKVNYRKFGVALRKVAALEGKGE